MNNSYAQLI